MAPSPSLITRTSIEIISDRKTPLIESGFFAVGFNISNSDKIVLKIRE